MLVAREYMDRKLEEAVSLHRWAEARLIALRLCEVAEREDFAEWHTLSSPLTVDSDG